MSDLKFEGKLTFVTEVKEISTTQKLSFLIETLGEHSRKVGFDIWGSDKIGNFLEYNKIGDEIEVSFNASSKEHNGSIYTNLIAWKVLKIKKDGSSPTSQTSAKEKALPKTENNDLPF